MSERWEKVGKWAAAAAVAAFLICGWLYYSKGYTVVTGKTVIRVWDWWNPAGSEALAAFFEKVETDFEARHPDIDLRFQFIPFGIQYVQKLMSAFAAGTPPDTFQCSIVWATDLYDRGVIADLNDLMADSPDIAPEAFFENGLKYTSKNGRVFGVPTSMDANALILNVDMLEEAGLDASPYAIDSWDTFAEYARRLTVRDENGIVTRAGYLLSATGERFSMVLPWLAAEGKDFLTDDLRSTNIATPEGITAMQFLYNLLHVDKVSLPPGTERQDDTLFMQGNAAMLIGGTWHGYHIFQKAPDLNFVMTTLPPGPHGKNRATMTWTNMMMMPKNCAHPKETWEFLRYYCGLENAINMLEILNRNSPRKDFYDTPQWKAAVEKYPYLETVPEICAAGYTYPFKRFEEINDTFRPYFQRALLGISPIEESMKEGNAAVERVLAGNWADELLREMSAPGDEEP